VLINLLSNASKFTDGGVITIEASVQDAPLGTSTPRSYTEASEVPNKMREVFVKVTDTGIGITPEDQKKLFQPFSQVDDSPTRKTGGSGLGLSISRLLIEMHGGRIGVESQVGEGSTFYFTLPIPPVEPEPGQITFPKSESGIAVSVTKPPLTILAIDEDNQVIKLYERYLAKHGYQIIECNDPALALAKTRQFHPYAVLLDVAATHKTPPFGGQPSPEPDQPANNGWKALQDLKQDTVTRTIPVIICTLLDGAQNQEKGVRMGASAYLLKPILEDDLVISLDSIKESL